MLGWPALLIFRINLQTVLLRIPTGLPPLRSITPPSSGWPTPLRSPVKKVFKKNKNKAHTGYQTRGKRSSEQEKDVNSAKNNDIYNNVATN